TLMWTAIIVDILDLASAGLGNFHTGTAAYEWMLQVSRAVSHSAPAAAMKRPAAYQQETTRLREGARFIGRNGWADGGCRGHAAGTERSHERAPSRSRILGSKTQLLRMLIAGQVRQSVVAGGPSSALKWRRESQQEQRPRLCTLGQICVYYHAINLPQSSSIVS
ncbi:MAG: hypothetical protein ABTQ30_09130, partial [Rhizobiaceae bacterium]